VSRIRPRHGRDREPEKVHCRISVLLQLRHALQAPRFGHPFESRCVDDPGSKWQKLIELKVAASAPLVICASRCQLFQPRRYNARRLPAIWEGLLPPCIAQKRALRWAHMMRFRNRLRKHANSCLEQKLVRGFLVARPVRLHPFRLVALADQAVPPRRWGRPLLRVQ
jgi:hypothetical protein